MHLPTNQPFSQTLVQSLVQIQSIWVNSKKENSDENFGIKNEILLNDCYPYHISIFHHNLRDEQKERDIQPHTCAFKKYIN